MQVIATGAGETQRNGVALHRTGAGERHGGIVSRALNFRRFQQAASARLSALVRPGDIVVAMTDPPLLAAHLAPLVTHAGARLVCWVQDVYPEIAAIHFGNMADLLAAPLRRRRDVAWRAAAACVTLGEDMRTTLLRGGAQTGTTFIIPNWAPRELHEPVANAAIAERRRAWGVEGKFVVAYSGNLGRVHVFATVLDAAALLRDSPEVVFLFIGRGPRFDEVARAVRERGLTNVRLLPPEPRERLAAALSAADAHLVTLRPEYASLVYPSKLAGVLAAARPVLFVGPAEGDIGRLLNAAQCGTAITPGNAAALADAVRRWHAAPDTVRRLGAAARTVYERDFTFATALARWQECLRSLAAP